jgi:hypothetical protein
MRISNPPVASSLMATARSFGNYDLAAALADLVDNSIQAKAKNISISFEPVEKDVVVRIRDDGEGMNKNKLIYSMRPASGNPNDPREASDLGRFGWGLKSASFSQAKILTVVSWVNSNFTAAIWDIDDLDDWSMELLQNQEALNLLTTPAKSLSGTEVIWSNCDRLLDLVGSSNLDEQLSDKISYAKRQLSLVFHRYLSGEVGEKLNIVVQGSALIAIDPFMSKHPATQFIDEDEIVLDSGSVITVKPFTIPHFSKLTIEEKNSLGGDEGLVRNQGFYVYRNKRLIISGTWFRLMPHGELSQLTRIRVDLPNTLDKDWKITLDKSDAQLPVALRYRLKDYIRKFSRQSADANKKKGFNISVDKKEPVWKRVSQDGRIRYLINRDHPLIWEMISEAKDMKISREALNIIESYVPTDSMIADREATNLNQVQAITDPEIFEALIDACFMTYLRQEGEKPTLKEFLNFVENMEPFSSQWIYSESYIKDNLKDKWGLQ